MRDIALGRVFAVVLVMATAGCATPSYRMHRIKERASFDLDCPNDQIRVSEVNLGRRLYGAEGCGRRVSYYARRCNRHDLRSFCSIDK